MSATRVRLTLTTFDCLHGVPQMENGTKRRTALRASLTLVLGLALATGLLVDFYRLLSSENARLYAAVAELGQTASLGKDTQSRIERFCGDCHAVPLPDSFPRYAWHSEIGKGYAAYARSGRQDLDPPPMDLTLAYYLSRAPERLTFPKPREADQELKVSFQVETIDSKEKDLRKPGVADLRWLRLRADGAASIGGKRYAPRYHQRVVTRRQGR